MLLPLNHCTTRPARLAVLSYDISHPRRARRVRAILEPLQHGRQYSVFEIRMPAPAVHGLLAECASQLDLRQDCLALWWPRDGLRLSWVPGQPDTSVRCAPSGGAEPRRDASATLAPASNFIVCYDVSDPDTLRSVGHLVAAHGAMVQRSVYWLRMPARAAEALLARCARALQPGDRLWAYPLHNAGALWRVGERDEPALFPIGTHHWREDPV